MLMINKDFCLSSYIALRYIYKDNIDFFDGMNHKNYKLMDNNKIVKVSNAEEIRSIIKKNIDNLYKKYNNIGILLSGGMDSAILSSFLKPGSHAYTFSNSKTDIYNLDIERSKKYCEKFNLIQHFVEIDIDDYKKYTPIVMERKCSPVHSIEPQIYKAAIQAKEDGVDLMIIGDAADYVFGGMNKLLSIDWKYDDFIKRYCSLMPNDVLVNPIDITGAFEPYKCNDEIDFVNFLSNGPTVVESYGSYENPFACANMPYYDPYEIFDVKGGLDLNRIRNGESKYLIRELYKIVFPEFEIPEKIPMPRPVDEIFKNWNGPTRKEFRNDIPMSNLTGNQKWQLWCAELFLNIYDK